MKKILFVLLLSLVFLAIITTQGCFLFRVIKLDIVTKNISLSIGESKTIQLTVKPIDTTLKFTSKNTSIATVSGSGTVTGISAGETEIEIEASKDKYKTVTKTVSVTVLAPSTCTVTFSVSDNQGAVQGANVAFNGENKSTDAQGNAVFTEVLAGSKAYTVSKEGYNDASGYINVDGDENVDITLTKKTYTIAATAGAGGSIDPSGEVEVSYGDSITFSILPDDSYTIEDVISDGVTIGPVDNYTYTKVTSDHTIHAAFRLKTYTLTTNTVGQGTVTKNPSKPTYDHGEEVELTATPDEGWSFVDWSGDLSGTANPANITMDSNKTVTATFTIKKYTIAASANPPAGGTITGAGSYDHGDTVNLVAAANEGYEFINWTENGVQVSANDAYSFMATANRTLVANFRLKTYTITATAGAGGSINPAGNVNVTHGSNQSFAITPNTGYEIEDVKVDGVSIGAVSTYNFTNVTTNHTIHATFRLKSYTIVVSANPPAGGTITGAGSYDHGDTVNLVAAANEGYEFINWTENGVQVSANDAYSFMATANRTLVANFRLKTYTITATAGAGGSINPAGNVNVTHGSNQSFAITPNTGYEIEDVKVDGVSIGAVSTYNFTNVTTNHTIHATFRLKSYTIVVSANPPAGGTITGAGSYDHGDTVNLVAAANEGYEFINWTENGVQVSANDAYSFMATANRTLVANFRLKTYTITATAGAGGSINPAGNVNVTHGSNQSFAITPNTGYEIEDVKVDGVSIGAVSTYNFTNVTTNHTIHATFRLKSYTIVVSANPPAGGTITGAGSYDHGDTVNLVAAANEGYEFINWTENGVQVSANDAYSFMATANRTLVANFRLKTYTITATAGAGGSINPAGNVNVTHGSNQSFAITPDTGYDIEDVKVDGVSVGAVSSYTFNNVTANHTIAATFKLKTYTLTTNVVGQGTVTKNPDKSKYNHGEVVQLTANPSAGWAFNTWSGDLSGSANPANLTMNGNKTVTANFVRVYTVTFNVSDNQGAVQGANVAFNGENRSTDAQGKAVFTNVQSGTRSYTISKTGYNNATGNVNVDGDKTVDIILTKKTYTIAVSANPTAGGTAAGGGVYTHGDTVNLSATPKEGYRFVNWTENGAQVSTNANYSFTATKNRTLVANFTTISKGTIQINNTTMDGFGQIDIYAKDFEFGVTAIEYVLSFDTTKLSVLAMSNDDSLGWGLGSLLKKTDGIIHFIAGGQPVNLAGRTKIATIIVSEISSGSTTIGFTSYVYNDSPVETAVADDSQPPQEIRSPNITLIPGTITIN
ncbi:MAG TPA: Ig-like domain-containing protein [Mesotoga infera]|nr:Ig-like domain-containing protein [Mesotoga infera]